MFELIYRYNPNELYQRLEWEKENLRLNKLMLNMYVKEYNDEKKEKAYENVINSKEEITDNKNTINEILEVMKNHEMI